MNNNNLNIFFTNNQKKKILENNGYTIKLEKRDSYETIYHDDYIETKIDIFIVYKNNKEVKADCLYPFSKLNKYCHINEVFYYFFNDVIYSFLLNFREITK